MTKLLMVANMKIKAKIVFVFNVKRNVVNSQKPHIIRYNATAALYSLDVAPSATDPVAEYEAAIPRDGSSRRPKESQKTANIPMTIIEKKLPMIHSKMSAKVRRTGPVKKKIPLVSQALACI